MMAVEAEQIQETNEFYDHRKSYERFGTHFSLDSSAGED